MRTAPLSVVRGWGAFCNRWVKGWRGSFHAVALRGGYPGGFRRVRAPEPPHLSIPEPLKPARES
ncbi:hypothetical protein BN874_20028 [Candidatus Contendobacter odensis Run_B_J11]|uniref:Uncharacterized protein n=1 Tax=Candidatus Contendobacter odensis Run_B_J11 TaxID=1400861 RepID=A0A7U7GAX7_9GAMM|nr:hypothetical protein BN874_20028 [Candidatus Contendobacter odensis Run_B_J11]